MENLNKVVQALTKKELSSFGKLLKNGTGSRSRKSGKLLRLLEYTVRENSGDDIECSKYVYQNGATAGFNMLKTRLRNRLLDFLLDNSLDYEIPAENKTEKEIRLGKKLYALRILSQRNLPYHIIENQLQGIIQQCRINEFSNLYRNCLEFKIECAAPEVTKEEFDSILQEFDVADKLQNSESMIKLTTAQFELKSRLDNPITSAELFKFINDSKKKLGSLKKISDKAEYLTKVLEVNRLLLNEEVKEAQRKCIELIRFIQRSNSVNSAENKSSVYQFLCQCAVKLGNYKSAQGYSESSNSFDVKNTPLKLNNRYWQFLAYFYDGKYSEALHIISSTKKELNLQRGFHFILMNYCTASVKFMTGEYEEANETLNKKECVFKQNYNWNCATRILSIMCGIELDRVGETSGKIERLRKYLDRNAMKFGTQEKRFKLILKTLHTLEKNGFSFKESWPKVEESIHFLETDTGNLGWEKGDVELIVFNKWFVDKTQK